MKEAYELVILELAQVAKDLTTMVENKGATTLERDLALSRSRAALSNAQVIMRQIKLDGEAMRRLIESLR